MKTLYSTLAGSCAAVVMGLALSGGVYAQDGQDEEVQDRGINLDPKAKGEPAQAVEDLALAGRLLAYGERENDPLALALGARLLRQTPVHEAQDQTKTEKGDAPEGGAAVEEQEKKEEAGVPLSAEQALAQARELAQGQDDMLALVEDIEAESGRYVTQASGGAAMHIDRVRSGMTDVYELEFLGGETAAVSLEGDGDTDLDLYIYDENGNLICASESYRDQEFCSWMPRWTGSFTVEILNLGSISNQYLINFQ